MELFFMNFDPFTTLLQVTNIKLKLSCCVAETEAFINAPHTCIVRSI